MTYFVQRDENAVTFFLETLETCASHDKYGSTTTPRILMLLEGFTSEPFTLKRKVSVFDKFFFEPTSMKFVFSSFILREFEQNQDCSSFNVCSSLTFSPARLGPSV